jgi:hypothetical protein
VPLVWSHLTKAAVAAVNVPSSMISYNSTTAVWKSEQVKCVVVCRKVRTEKEANESVAGK